MNFFRRGIISVLRKRGKSAILLILVFILGNVMAGVISIKEAVGNTQQIMREKIGVLASIEADYEAYSQSGSTEPIASIPVETIEAIGHLKQVKQYDYLARLWLESTEFEAYYPDGGNVKPLMSSTDAPAITREAVGGDGGEYQQTYSFELVGGQNPDISDIVHGKISLSQGRVFSQDEIDNSVNAVLISRKFAELNGLGVGSTFQLEKSIYSYYGEKRAVDLAPIKPVEPVEQTVVTKTFELSVIGIFEPTEVESTDGGMYYSSRDWNNMMYTTNRAINLFNRVITETEKELNGTEYSGSYTYVLPVFALKDPLELEAFRSEATPLLPAVLQTRRQQRHIPVHRHPDGKHGLDRFDHPHCLDRSDAPDPEPADHPVPSRSPP